MKKRRMKKWVKKLLLILIIYSIGIGAALLISYRAEQVDKTQKKELPAVTQSNSK